MKFALALFAVGSLSAQDLLRSGRDNWTRSAATKNDENIVVTNNPKIVKPFTGKFNELWRQRAKPRTTNR
ncbi:MAG: hypothetical protein OSB05_11060 [Akkermansiaceae bacterium]|nr:hypothetical protein [Akkermansiaceae bacterium]